MINFQGDLLKGTSWHILCQICNVYHTFGSGIAAQIKQVYPEMYQADLDTEYDCDSKLGTYSFAVLPDDRLGFNVYAMKGMGNDGTPLGRNLCYDHIYNALIRIIEYVNANYEFEVNWDGKSILNIGVPARIGCDRAGGSWPIVLAMLEDIEDRYPNVTFHIYEL